MKKSEVLKAYRDSIAESMVEHYRAVLESEGRIEYKIYIWDDGELEVMEEVQGSNDYLVAKDWETRTLHYVATIDSPCFDPWDYTEEDKPDDDDERETMEQDIINYLVSEYRREGVWDTLREIIREAERDEKYGL